ncbi:MAG: hypothetical protein KF833_04120 [Verrucomicrobiae bacterium]|nr:hypothetical protein [Verrucomicrobiae bacterium]
MSAGLGLLAMIGMGSTAGAAERVYSGPQPGEAVTPFRVVEVAGPAVEAERDPVTEAEGGAVALVFVHALERSMAPLLRAIDRYGAQAKERLRTEVVFLVPDRLEGERRVRAASGSLRLHSRVGVSVDGIEGPGNFGLNRECMMTIVAARGNRVWTNFALVQPGVADAPAVIGALSRLAGDREPPDLRTLIDGPGERPMAMERRGGEGPAAVEPFPGAVPSDDRLNGLLRQFLRPTQDAAAADRLLEEIEGYVRGDEGLMRQAIAGWERVLHFGDRYGTAHAREAAQGSLERLRKELATR